MAAVAHTRQKDFGAFYTPQPMAAALVDWAIRESSDTVLDPSFGGLMFLSEADRRLRDLGASDPKHQLYGVDLDAEAFDTAYAGITPNLLNADFLLVPADGHLPQVSAVVGNPPYVRYQSFRDSRDQGREICARHGIKLTRLASSWAPLLIHAIDFVAPGGRLAQVLPAELIHAQYSGQILEHVCSSFSRVVVAMFDEQVFPGAQEEVILLVAEGRGQERASGPEIVSATNLDDLRLDVSPRRPPTLYGDHKLLAGLVESDTLALYDRLRASEQAVLLGALASVDIGAVTGANSFFVRSADAFAEVPPEWLRPTVSKAVHVPGARLSAQDIELLDERSQPARMLVLEAKSYTEAASVQAMIAAAERDGIHERYKCRIRSPWWALPARQVADPPDLFLTYMANEMPRLVANEAGALSTNTIHGVRLYNGTDPRGLAASFYNSLTLLSAELVGRSYGGGVLKLEPTEAERLIMPLPASTHARLLPRVDELVRARRYDDLQTVVDQAILVDQMEIEPAGVEALRGAVVRLRGRRRQRASGRR